MTSSIESIPATPQKHHWPGYVHNLFLGSIASAASHKRMGLRGHTCVAAVLVVPSVPRCDALTAHTPKSNAAFFYF